jgi:hypothetical protein
MRDIHGHFYNTKLVVLLGHVLQIPLIAGNIIMSYISPKSSLPLLMIDS